MKENIIFSWADATWKTTRAEELAEQGYILSILMKEIDIVKKSIKENIILALNQWSQCKKTVMDRSIIDLLAYYYINEKKWLTDKNVWIWSLFWIRQILKEFIISNKWSIVNHMIASNEVIIKRLKNRKKEWKELSKNDIKIMNTEGYLEDFIDAFNKIISILEALNKKMWNLIEINIIDTTSLPRPDLKIKNEN